eukprot:CAMPEP_0197175762 /NCGR_PEP_ID=MMETSP1423-20130617/1899_1 /TAXON_ID=476441 /ORGANISM="Pseudo-nitzschia heimii, Strain UNC1101" /LENGTH=50 /DNA_ID=CAMNT_0042624995 /DNA_START=6 /DNA_END=154 /DNA_ORIENTATION=-
MSDDTDDDESAKDSGIAPVDLRFEEVLLHGEACQVLVPRTTALDPSEIVP